MWLWMVLCVICVIAYSLGYTLLRTSGDGRSWRHRLLHPSKGALQEEYGGTGGREVEDRHPKASR